MTQTEFQQYLTKILSARYGEEVRGSIHDALKGMNEIVQQNVLDVTTAKQTIDTAAAAANSAATKANQAATEATTAKNAANTAASAANTAKTNADAATTKANEAASAANTAKTNADTATTKANEAASAANTAKTNADTATTKANEAASKASEATQKAETATNRANDAAAIIETLDIGDIDVGEIATKRYVGEQIDGIEIGGRNLLLSTGDFDPNNFGLGTIYHDGEITYRKIYNLWKAYVSQNVTLEHGYYVLSCLARNNAKNPVDLYVYFEDDYSYQRTVKIIDNQWRRYTFAVFSIGKNMETALHLFTRQIEDASSPETSIDVAQIKFERGNKATDWTPAPEDLIIEVGGRNLFGFNKGISFETYCADVESPDFQMNMAPAVHGYTFKTGSDIVGDGRNMYFRAKNLGFNSIQGWYTFSADISATKDCSIYMGICETVLPDMNISKTPTHYSYSGYVTQFTEPNNTNGFVDLRASMGGGAIPADTTITLANVKIERGNVPTDWTPAPEDVQPAIFDSSGNVQLSAENLQKLAISLKTYLN